jgi:hypothetical protein
LNHLQEKALMVIGGEIVDDSLAIFEWSAPPNCDTGDREAWASANPALGLTITEETIASDHTTDAEPVFRTEVLCQRVPSLAPPPIDPDAWAELAVEGAVSSEAPRFFLDVSPGLRSAAVAGATVHDKVPYVKLADYRAGVGWVQGRVRELVEQYPQAMWQYEATGPASALVEALKLAGVEVAKPFNTTEMARGCAHLEKLVNERAVTHSGDDAVTMALEAAARRDLGDPGLWAWGKKKSTGDISPLVAVTGALWLLETSTVSLPRIF